MSAGRGGRCVDLDVVRATLALGHLVRQPGVEAVRRAVVVRGDQIAGRVIETDDRVEVVGELARLGGRGLGLDLQMRLGIDGDP